MDPPARRETSRPARSPGLCSTAAASVSSTRPGASPCDVSASDAAPMRVITLSPKRICALKSPALRDTSPVVRSANRTTTVVVPTSTANPVSLPGIGGKAGEISQGTSTKNVSPTCGARLIRACPWIRRTTLPLSTQLHLAGPHRRTARDPLRRRHRSIPLPAHPPCTHGKVRAGRNGR